MTTPTQSFPSVLYEQDYSLWLELTANKLKQGEFSLVDIDNLIEEIESMGRSEKQALESLLIILLVHLLKLAYWEVEIKRNENHWITEIATFRVQIRNRIRRSPSLKPYVQNIFEDCYDDAREIVTRKKMLDPSLIPTTPFLTLEQTLDKDWFPQE